MPDPLPGRTTGPPRAPGPLRAARVLVWLQVGCWGLAVLAGVFVACRALTERSSLVALGVFLGVLIVLISLVALAMLVPPVVVLRDSRRGTRTGSLFGLCVGQVVTAAPVALLPLVLPADAVVAVPLSIAIAAFAVVVVVLAAQPASRAWAARP